jgi:hypothetical protein
MDKQMRIGKASKLGKTGELVSVLIDGNTVTARIAKTLSSTQVLVLFDGKYYHAYPDETTAKAKTVITSLAKTDKKNPKKKYSEDAVILYRVKYPNGGSIPCTYPYWNYYEGTGCVRVCGSGQYGSYGTCTEDNEPPASNIYDDKYSVGYFKRGFLSVLGAPSTELGFFYPITTGSPTYTYCPGMFYDTGFTQPGAESSVIRGDGRYTYRRWVLPEPRMNNPYELYLPSTDTRVLQHSYYPDTSRINAAVLQQWNTLYRLNFYRDGSGLFLTGDSDQVMGDNIPWEASLQKLNADGSLMEGLDSDFSPPFKWIGYPNWLWRQVDIKAIAIYDTIYFNGDQSYFFQDTFRINAGQNRRFMSGDTNYTYTDIRRPTSILPPASIISRTYSNEEEAPLPPGGGWQLLWDTRTCPPPPPIDIDLEFDKYMYYVSVNGGEPRLLDIFRSDDNVQVYLTNLGKGRYRCGVRSGTRTVNGVQYFARTKIFTSESDAPFVFDYPSAIPEVPEDWQDFRYRDWKIVPDINTEIDICLRGFFGPGLNVIPSTQTFIEIGIPSDLVSEGINSVFTVASYATTPPIDTNPEQCSVTIVDVNIPLFLPAINTPAPPEDVEVLAISVYSDRK